MARVGRAHEAVSLQLEIRARVPRGYQLTRDLMDAAVRAWAEEGDAPEGFDIKIIDWENSRGKFTPQSQDEARERFGRLLQQGRFTVLLRKD